MATFPTLYRRGTEVHNPLPESVEDTMAHNPTVRSPESVGGYVTTRARFTRIPRSWPAIKYEWLSLANVTTLKTFETTTVVAGSLNFDWTNPLDSTVYDVRLLGPIRYTPTAGTNKAFWTVEFGLEEV